MLALTLIVNASLLQAETPDGQLLLTPDQLEVARADDARRPLELAGARSLRHVARNADHVVALRFDQRLDRFVLLRNRRMTEVQVRAVKERCLARTRAGPTRGHSAAITASVNSSVLDDPPRSRVSVLPALSVFSNALRICFPREDRNHQEALGWLQRFQYPPLVLLESGEQVFVMGIQGAVPPEVIGKATAEGRELLIQAGFNVTEPQFVFDETAPKGTVMRIVDDANKPAAAEAPKGTTLTLVVSNGPDQRAVPAGLELHPHGRAARLFTTTGAMPLVPSYARWKGTL